MSNAEMRPYFAELKLLQQLSTPMLVLLSVLISTAASAETVTTKIPWKGNYAHNSTDTWSRENKEDSGFSKNFRNGAPEELGMVQEDGELNAEIIMPNKFEPMPFVILLHGCMGISPLTKAWSNHVAEVLNAEGISTSCTRA
jgi:hypothetical protein